MENLGLIAAVAMMALGAGWLTWALIKNDPASGEVEEDFTATYLSDHPNKDRSWQ